MEAKYICAELSSAAGTCFGAIIFPSFMSHAVVARKLGIKAKHAGMCRRDSDGWHCYGESVTLQVRSDPDDDASLLNRMGMDS